MQQNDPQTYQYSQHYKQLELSDNDNWDTARTHYRRLVHLWHPDRFAQRPRERAHAQQQFINLTKAYNALRNFHRKNHRLPFQSAHTATQAQSADSHSADDSPTLDNNDAVLDDNLLRREPKRRGSPTKKSSTIRKVAWLMVGGTMMLGTAMVFLILDRNANKAVAEQGREIVKDAPQSEFLPNAAEIRRSQTRGAFIKPTQ